MKEKIQTKRFVLREGDRIPVTDLPPEQREALAVWLKETYLNELFRGQGRVFPGEKKEKT